MDGMQSRHMLVPWFAPAALSSRRAPHFQLSRNTWPSQSSPAAAAAAADSAHRHRASVTQSSRTHSLAALGTKSKRDDQERKRKSKDCISSILTVIQSTRWLLISDCNMSGCTHFLISNWHRFALVLAGVALGHSHYRQNWPPPKTHKITFNFYRLRKINVLYVKINLTRYPRQPQISFFLPIYRSIETKRLNKALLHASYGPRNAKRPLITYFLFAINLIGFFHADCQTLSKFNWAVFVISPSLRLPGKYYFYTSHSSPKFQRLFSSIFTHF
jgi:hypothetical protein